LTGYARKIRAQAEERDPGAGFIDLTVIREDGDDRPTRYSVPRRAFRAYALRRTEGRHLAPEWDAVCPPGLKLYANDDPLHSDFMFGSKPRITTDDWYGPLGGERDSALCLALYDEEHRIQAELLDFEVTVLAGTGHFRGLKVVHPKENQEITERGVCVVVPDASPAYYIPAHSAAKLGGVVITETGGAVAHLVVVGEGEIPIVRIPDAIELYPKGAKLDVDFSQGRVSLLPYT
jgi:phosphohistidine swiveling domain-containing protein